jgi:CRISPR-associated protein Csb2
VNEGDVEWPPSQWRILRAIISTWLKTANHYSEDDVKPIILQMIGKPSYFIPRATVTHKRHYMPPPKGDKTLVLDTFLAFEEGAELIAVFPDAELNEEQVGILDDILRNMNYLGRSESWVNARVRSAEDVEMNAYPIEEAPGKQEDSVSLFCLNEGGGVDVFQKEDDRYSHPLFTYARDLTKQKYTYPDGVSFVKYAVPEDRFSRINKEKKEKPVTRINYAKYLVDSTVLPSKKSSVEVADVARNAVLKLHKNPSPIFSGKDTNGNTLKEHSHAFYLPYDADGDGKIDHLVIYSREGFDRDHQRTLFDLNKLYGYDLEKELNLMLLGMGQGDDLPDNGKSPVLGPAHYWESCTPLLLTRHPKTKRGGEWKTKQLEGVQIAIPNHLGHYATEEDMLWDYGVVPYDRNIIQKDGPVSQVLRAIDQMGLPQPISITPKPGTQDSRWLEFKRYRRGKKSPAMSIPYGFKLEFEEDVKGPICLGYGAHQGLGMFKVSN